MKQQYQEISFRKNSIRLIDIINVLLDQFRVGGYTVTVRQLYYQLVARDLIENTVQSYKKITGLVNDARMAGLMDWDMIEDRTRSFERLSHWYRPSQIIKACGEQYHIDMWGNQETRVFCVVEKEALAGVLYKACQPWDVPLLAARGYPSVTVLREFAVRDIIPALENGQNVHILHLGDHDPSGIDMSRGLRARLELFSDPDRYYRRYLTVERLALNMDQVEEQKPPPNPAKETDSRFADYAEKYGDKSWELDALPPDYIDNLVQSEISYQMDEDKWKEKEKEREDGRKFIGKYAKMMREEEQQGNTMIPVEISMKKDVEDMTLEEVEQRIDILEDEMTANEEENQAMQNELNKLYDMKDQLKG